MVRFGAVYDACVLYPAPLRDFLLRLACTGLFRARWTNAIHDEWIRNLLEERPDLDLATLARTRELMDRAIPDCLVEGYESLIQGIELPDADDRHVVAAAIRGRADVIVTFNLDDFPAEALRPYGVEAQHPDEFISYLLNRSRARGRVLCRQNVPPATQESTFHSCQLHRLPRPAAACCHCILP